IADGQIVIENEDERLGGEDGPEYGGAGDPAQEEGDEEQSDHRAIEDGTHDVPGLDEVLGQIGKQCKTDGDQSPKNRETFGGDHVVPITGLAFGEVAIEVDGGGRAKGVQLGGLGG